ncbi:MAG TPA: chemotaxis-specific protein-glutamate methyltransferase CheB [Vicinamibacterales bacterium]|nr:chemotaxis-specific protein-glutamate methyltransferase CheB [Vicinamibacterales bacterium]
MRIGIASDVPAKVRALRKWVMEGTRHHVVWTATDVTEAARLAADRMADLVLLDVPLGGVAAPEATRQIVAASPCPILIVTDSVQANTAAVFEAMGQGALDAVDIPPPDAESTGQGIRPFLTRVDRLSRLIGDADGTPAGIGAGKPAPGTHLVAIGASAGGPAALATLLAGLPKNFPAAIVIVQHVDAQFAAGLVDWLGRHSKMPVRLAAGGDLPTDGSVFVAGTGDHLVVKPTGHFSYCAEPEDHVYRPSIDVFFQSVHRDWRGGAVGVLLTGMGRDGAAGLKQLHDQGRHTIAQDEASSALYGMPKAAAAIGAATEILPIDRIAARLIDLVRVSQSRHPVRQTV